MPFEHVQAIEVILFGHKVGVLAAEPGVRASYAFEYYPAWLRQGFSISPLHLPLTPGTKTFKNLSEDTWYGLPPAIADALPDRFGNALINAHLAQKGVVASEITPLDRLAYVANRAMGALEFKPARSLGRQREDILDVVELVAAARDALEGSLATNREAKQALQRLLSVGVSAGGARAKAVVNVDPHTQALTAGHKPQPGCESWLLKFDGMGADAETGMGATQPYGRIEYAYSLMAKAAGIHMPPTRLLEENGRAHFMVRRFDRIDAATGNNGETSELAPAVTTTAPTVHHAKLHMQSLCALDQLDFNLLHTNEYASLFTVIRRLGLDAAALTEAFRRMAFNHLAANCDDHSKNFSFLMDATGTWQLAPAYDLTFAYNSRNIWLREHLLGVDGQFSNVTPKDLARFVDTHQIPRARQVLKELREAIAAWPSFAAQAGLLPKDSIRIAEYHVI